MSQIEAEYYMLINSDVEVTSNWLQPLVSFMDSHTECSACQPKILSMYNRDSFEYAGAAGGFIDKYGYPFCRGRVFDKVEKDNGQYDSIAEIFGLQAHVCWSEAETSGAQEVLTHAFLHTMKR